MTTKAKAAPAKAKATPKANKSADPFDAAYERWLKGEQVCVLAGELKIRRGALRRQLRKRAGGKEAFQTLRQTTVAGGVRKTMGERAAAVSQDKDAKVIPIGGRGKWTHRWHHTADATLPVFVTHDKGVEYVAALRDQRADAVVKMGNGLPDGRLVIFKG